MRKLLYDTLRDSAGNIISSATVSVFLAGTSTAVNLYSTATSATPATITTSTDGSYTAYIDMFEVSTDQTFKITFSNAFTSLTVDNISVTDVVLGTYTISTAKVCPYDIGIPKGVVFAKSGSGTLTFSKSFTAGQYQVFSGFTKSVDVTFSVVPLVVWDRWFDGTSATGDETVSSATITTGNITTSTIGTANLTTVNKTGTGLVTNLNADLHDGFNASATPAANTIPVSGVDNFLASGWGVRINRLNNTSYVSLLSGSNADNNYTIGPTGSGADIIFSHLDSIPAGSRFAILSMKIEVIHTADASADCSSIIKAYFNDANNYVYGSIRSDAYLADSTTTLYSTMIIPLDANKIFKVGWASVKTANSTHSFQALAMEYVS